MHLNKTGTYIARRINRSRAQPPMTKKILCTCMLERQHSTTMAVKSSTMFSSVWLKGDFSRVPCTFMSPGGLYAGVLSLNLVINLKSIDASKMIGVLPLIKRINNNDILFMTRKKIISHRNTRGCSYEFSRSRVY